jgi:hypothetical protein
MYIKLGRATTSFADTTTVKQMRVLRMAMSGRENQDVQREGAVDSEKADKAKQAYSRDCPERYV